MKRYTPDEGHEARRNARLASQTAKRELRALNEDLKQLTQWVKLSQERREKTRSK